MNHQLKIGIVFLLSTYLPLFANGQTVDPLAVDGELHFKITSDPGFVLDGYTGGDLVFDAIFTVSGLDSIFKPFPLPGTELDSIYRVVFPNAVQADALRLALEALPYVSFAEKNPLMFTFQTPNDLLPQQWHLNKIQAPLAWNHSTGSSNVLVAVLDDAIAIDHEDLAANIYTNTAEQSGLTLVDDDLNGKADDVHGYDVADGDNDPRPPASASANDQGFAHGTHVAGIVSAATDNGSGVASIGYSTSILPVKIGRDSDAALTGAADGIYYAMRSGADVINMSFGTLTDAATLKSLIVQAYAAGITLVAAAGNDGDETVHYPAAYPEVISVGATDQNDQRAGFSNVGSTIDVMAPGVDIYSTLPEGNDTYGTMSGTSMATPLVSGLAALVKDVFSGLGPAQIAARIEQGCEDISTQNPGLDGKLGAGRINAFLTLGNVGVIDQQTHAFSIYPNPTERYLNIRAEGITSVQLLDATGRTVVLTGNEQVIDLSGLPKGVYQVILATTTSVYSTKIVLL